MVAAPRPEMKSFGMPGMRHVRTHLQHSQLTMDIADYKPGDWVEMDGPATAGLRNQWGDLPFGKITRRGSVDGEWLVQPYQWGPPYRFDDVTPHPVKYEKRWHSAFIRPMGDHYRGNKPPRRRTA